MFLNINLKKIKKIFEIIILILVLLFLTKKAIDYVLPVKYGDEINKYAIQYGLEKELVYAVINAESRFNPSAVSNKGAIGIMQIMPETGEWLVEKGDLGDFFKEDLYLPKRNIEIGCFYLNYLLEKHKDERLALCAYNAGSANVYKWLNNEEYTEEGQLNVIPFKETEKYVQKIEFFKKAYKIRFKIEDILTKTFS